jgi:hypothetical protein
VGRAFLLLGKLRDGGGNEGIEFFPIKKKEKWWEW